MNHFALYIKLIYVPISSHPSMECFGELIFIVLVMCQMGSVISHFYQPC